MRHKLTVLNTAIFSLFIGCSSSETSEFDGGSIGAEVTDAALTDATDISNPFGEGALCPTLVDGQNTIMVNGVERSVTIALPAEPTGAPLVYAWHWLSGSATQALNGLGMANLANEGAIVIAPSSSGLQFEWDFLASPDTSVDIALFDEVSRCAWESWRIDSDRIYSTGMSAGGLMTSYLTVHRSDVLAATVPLSGGAPAANYRTPERLIPVMVVWGGTGDTLFGFNFHAESLNLSNSLQADGHFVVECIHSGGHAPPADAAALAWSFFDAHRKSDTIAPWQAGLPGELPSYCQIP